MVEASIWVMNLLGVAVYILAGYLLITKVFPILRDILSVFKDQMADAIMGLFNVVVIVFVIGRVLDRLAAIGQEGLSYFEILRPIVELFNQVLPYFEYLVGGAILVAALSSFRKKK